MTIATHYLPLDCTKFLTQHIGEWHFRRDRLHAAARIVNAQRTTTPVR
jgi:hypothetical protein